MLKDYEWEFCLNLHKKLKEKIKGRVHTTVKDDTLLVTIQMGKLEFKTEFDNFGTRISEGCTTDMIVYDVYNSYKKYILDLYFV